MSLLTVNVKTLSAYEIIYTDKKNNIDIKIKHALTKDKDTLYELKFIAPIDQYDQYISEINTAIYSFRIL